MTFLDIMRILLSTAAVAVLLLLVFLSFRLSRAKDRIEMENPPPPPSRQTVQEAFARRIDALHPEPLPYTRVEMKMPKPISRRILDAIIAVEGVKDPHKPGKNGELTIYQFRPSVWGQYSKVSMTKADDQEIERVAMEHYTWIMKRLQSLPWVQGMPLAEQVALLWNAGYGNVYNARISRAQRDYAKRAQNIFASTP